MLALLSSFFTFGFHHSNPCIEQIYLVSFASDYFFLNFNLSESMDLSSINLRKELIMINPCIF